MGDNPPDRPLHRRPLLLALAGSGVAFTGIGVAARSGVLSGDAPDGRPETESLQLTGGDSLVPTLTVPLADRLAALPVRRRTRTLWLDVATVTMVGLTWRRGAAAPQVELSTRVGGVWQPWQGMPHVHEPAGAEGEAPVVGTDVVWTGPADGVRLRVHGEPPPELALVLLHPEELPADETPGDREARVTRASLVRAAPRRPRRVPKPRQMYGRRAWGANERWRDGDPVYNDTIAQVHVHHTVSSNDYRPKDVPAMIRGMYAYHTKHLGWSDIGYNFLVDRFGRTWVGRAGGPRNAVRGAHTLGFNSTSTGVAVIGNFETARPSRAVIGALARLAAWKLSRYDRNPEGRVRVVSSGSDKYRSGARVRLRVIDGHRDTNDTACPGRYLYAELPRVRRRAAARIERFERPPA